MIPKDFHLNPSQDYESAISQCRSVLASGILDEAQTLWKTLVGRARESRLGDGTIDLLQLWHELRNKFQLNDHPNFSSGWKLLDNYTREHRNKIETTLPSGYSLPQSKDRDKLVQALLKYHPVVLYGDSGTGKSALAKSTLDNHFAEAAQIWLSPDTLSVTLSVVKRSQTDLAYPLADTLKATAHPSNIMVIDAAERINSELVTHVKQLIGVLVSEHFSDKSTVWQILIIGQTEAWVDGRLQALLGEIQPTSVGIEPVSVDDVRLALRTTPQLNGLDTQDDALPALTNLRALAWIMQASSQFRQQITSPGMSLTTIADSLWQFWTNGELSLQGILMRLAEREASFEHSVGLSSLSAAEAQALQSRPAQLPVRVTSENRIEFQHDLAADWARYQRLKEFSDDTAKWVALTNNPLWTGALRMLGQFLLRKQINDRTEWDIAFEKLNATEHGTDLAADILLDALWLDPHAESLLAERTALLFANNGAVLTRLLNRFNHIATVPSDMLPSSIIDTTLTLYFEAQNRIPIIRRWPPVVRFLATHRDRVASLMSPTVAKLCERWLTVMPVEISGKPTPLRKELANIALATARELQVTQGKGNIIFADNSEKFIYSAALAGAPDIPDDVSAWALEMAQRRPWHTDVVTLILDYHSQKAKEHNERLRTDPEYRATQKRSVDLPISIPSAKKLPPWPLGPKERVERHFRECFTNTSALAPLMRTRPDVASEVLLAMLIEDSPEEPYNPDPSLSVKYGLEYDYKSYPTAFWKSPFYVFLPFAPDNALETLISLVDFCTEHWDHERQRRGVDPIYITLEFPEGTSKKFIGNRLVLGWGQDNSTSAGQLHSALSALEKWLCVCLDNDTDISPYVQRLLKHSNSVAILGVLINVGKYRHALFEGLLCPLLGHQALYFWDEDRLRNSQFGFDALAWANQGETIFQMAREWTSATYRRASLQNMAAHLVAFKPKVAVYLAAIIKHWELPEHEQSALEVRMLQARLNYNNYKDDPDGTDGHKLFEYPESLQSDLARYQNTTEPTLRLLTLPYECKQLLGQPEELSTEKTEDLASFLNADLSDTNTDVSEEDKQLARIAAASTLLTHARPWLDIHPEVRDNARSTIHTVINQIDDDCEFLRGRITGNKSELEFVAHAIIRDFICSPNSIHAGHAVLRVLTCGSTTALAILTSRAYIHREQLNGTWWRLLEISLLWCALAILVPRLDEPQELHKLWRRWLKWLRARKLMTTDRTIAHVNPLSVARRVERLQRRRWIREFNQEDGRFGIDPSERRSLGLDTDFLTATFAWLFQNPYSDLQQSDTTENETMLLFKHLLDFELWPHLDHDEEDRDKPPTQLGYDIIRAIANVVPSISLESASELWQPLLGLGGKAYYIAGYFIDCWLQEVSKNCDIVVFAQHWKKMIIYVLTSSNRATGRHWLHEEWLLRRLLGCGSELSLDQVTGLQRIVLQMKELYKTWSNRHLGRDEGHIRYFCGFLSSNTGLLIRVDGMQWLLRSIHQKGIENLYLRRSETADAMINLLDVLLVDNNEELIKSAPARDAFLEMVAILVKLQIPASLVLQERARAKLT